MFNVYRASDIRGIDIGFYFIVINLFYLYIFLYACILTMITVIIH